LDKDGLLDARGPPRGRQGIIVPIELAISPQGRLVVHEVTECSVTLPPASEKRIASAFAQGTASGLLHLATAELQSSLPAPFDFGRAIGSAYLTRLCQNPAPAGGAETAAVSPDQEAIAALVRNAPPLAGLEYLREETVAAWWMELDAHVREEISRHPSGAEAYLREKNPLWRLVGRVTLHLAENKRDPEHPFAFLATYATRLSSQGRVQHEPLGKALQQYAGGKNRAMLLALLAPLERAAEQCALVKELVASGDIYHPLAWTPREAHRFLQETVAMEQSGVIVRVPDWWHDKRPPRPKVAVRVGQGSATAIDAESLLSFSVDVALDGESLSEDELQSLLDSSGGLVSLRGKWVEVDREKIQEALKHWKQVARATRDGVTFFEGMRLLSGATLDRDAAAAIVNEEREWTGITADDDLARLLSDLRDPARLQAAKASGLRADLRPYQQVGVNWLQFLIQLGLGACLADDMGLGKTVQVIALLLSRKESRLGKHRQQDARRPSLLIVPASLIANWKSELARFAPALAACVVHPSEAPTDEDEAGAAAQASDVVITTYTMLAKLEWLRARTWDLAILDEAQAIKNAATRQARTVKELKSAGRIALTGTPVENRLDDLWSIFDFLNPGLLGSAKTFASVTKKLNSSEGARFGPLRSLVQPYILRRLKTDKSVIEDLPDKTEVTAFCPLTKKQAALYERAVRELADRLRTASGMERRGLVLGQLMRLKQICNHPSQLLGDGRFEGVDSGKFQRLAAIAEELAARQERALVFTQFREMTGPLAEFLAGVFGRPGLVLHGGISVARRKDLVASFARDDGPPFFVLSLKAGGTGLNLTAASHVVHFDRWWNPAVENQATDRAFRIGQRRNVLVHKFVCRGTVEQRIDAMIEEKKSLANDLLEGGAENSLTEMSTDALLQFVALDIRQAVEN
jgi:hypothetical protein